MTFVFIGRPAAAGARSTERRSTQEVTMNGYVPRDLVDEMLNVAARVEQNGGHYGNALMAVVRITRARYGWDLGLAMAKDFLAELGWTREQEVTR